MLTDAQKKHLRQLGHECKAIVLAGKSGIGAALIAEVDRALTDHELVKIRARLGDRDERDSMLAELAKVTGAELVQRIGHVALFYRANPEKQRIMLPG